MAEERVQRRLAAILAADVVGYSRLMEAEEESTLARMKKLRNDVIDPKVTEYSGRIFKTTGDGFLAEFPSAVDAVRQAVDVQRAMAQLNANVPEDKRIAFRIGISLGDVMVDGDDLFGNGVNVAARLEGLAEPGGICVSGNVYEHIDRSLDVKFEDLGEQSVKNIDRPVRCHRVHLEPDAAEGALSSNQINSPSPLDRPAVAVLPFENMSGDPEQEYFADGLTEDIITALSQWRSFPVIARNSTFTYKGTSPDIRKVGEELGAGYVVEGSVRKAGSRVRVTAQLIHAETGHHVWAERYDRELEDIFELQDEVTHQIAAIIAPEMERAEQQRIISTPPTALAAWEYWLRGYSYIYEQTKEGNEKAREMFNQAIALDPNYARAHTGLAFTYARDLRLWPPDNTEEWMKLFSESSRRAVALDEGDSEARAMLGRVHWFMGDFDAAIAELNRAVELNPHRAWTNNSLGNALITAGKFEEGIPWIENALRLDPLDPRQHLLLTHLALGHLGVGNYEKAIELAGDAIRRRPDFIEPHFLMASAFGYLAQPEDAKRAIGSFLEASKEYIREARWYALVTKDCILDGLRKASLAD